MLLVVMAEQGAVATDDHGAVVDDSGEVVRQGEPRHHVAARFRGGFPQGAHRGAVDRLGQLGDARPDDVELIARGKQFGEHHEVGVLAPASSIMRQAFSTFAAVLHSSLSNCTSARRTGAFASGHKLSS